MQISFFHKFKITQQTYKVHSVTQTHHIEFNDYLNNTQFVIEKTPHTCIITPASEFNYYKHNHKINFLGSTTDRLNNRILKQRAHNYAVKLIQQRKDKIQIYTDGSVRGNPRKKGGACYAIKNSDNEEPLTRNMSIQTNSIAIAEITAIINALSKVSTASKKDIVVFCDNKYVVGVANNIYQCNHKHLHQP